MSEPCAWAVVATVPEHPELMPRGGWRDRWPAWYCSSSSWMSKPLTKRWREADGQRSLELVAGEKASKTWKNQTTAKAQATVARNCGFDVEVIPLYADETDWEKVAREKERYATEATLNLIEANAARDAALAEVEALKVELGKDRIYITQLEAAIRDKIAVENHSI